MPISYVETLQMLINVFIIPLREAAGLYRDTTLGKRNSLSSVHS